MFIRRRAPLMLLAAALSASGASAKVCDLWAESMIPNAKAVASLRVDTDKSEVEYDILTNGLGTLTAGSIDRQGSLFLTLPLVGIAGSAVGTVVDPAPDFTDLVDNPENFLLNLTGDGAVQSVSIAIERIGDCVETVVPVDLKLQKIKVKASGKVIVKVRNLSTEQSLASTVRFLASLDRQAGPGDVFVGSDFLPSIAPQKKQKVKTRLDPPNDLAGSFFVIGFADPGDSNNDPNPDNNQKATKTPVDFR